VKINELYPFHISLQKRTLKKSTIELLLVEEAEHKLLQTNGKLNQDPNLCVKTFSLILPLKYNQQTLGIK